jgi:hypothetical protein
MMTALMAVSIGQVGKIRAVQRQEVRDMVRRDILRVVKADLKAALPIPLIDKDGVGQAHFLGKPDEIRFVAYVPIGFRAYGVREVRYVLTTDDDKRLLLVRELRRHENRNSSGIEREEMQLGSEQAARFQFPDNAVQGEFGESWKTRLAFPSSIRISFAGETAAGRNSQSILLYP